MRDSPFFGAILYFLTYFSIFAACWKDMDTVCPAEKLILLRITRFLSFP